MSARISIITRTQGRPIFLDRCLQSVSGQTMQDFEFIIVNDGGDLDAVRATVQRHFALDDPRLVIVDNQPARGRNAAISSGTDRASAPLLVLHDDDDYWDPAFLEQCCEWMDQHPSALGVAARCAVVHERVSDEVIEELSREALDSESHTVTLYQTAVRNSVPPIALVLRSAPVNSVGGYDGAKLAMADWELMLRVLELGEIGLIDGEPLAFWSHRDTPGGTTSNSIVKDASLHKRFNQEIRDAFMREHLTDGNSLGVIMAVATAQRAIEERLDRLEKAQAEHLEAVAQSQAEHLEAVRVAIELAIANAAESVRTYEPDPPARGFKAVGAKLLGGRSPKSQEEQPRYGGAQPPVDEAPAR